MEKIPLELSKELSPPKLQELWKRLTPIARRDFIGWIESAKLAETRTRRVKRVPDMLKSGKRRPCCYAIVPMGLYKALDNNTKAKKYWKTLSPDERRDFVAWVEKVNGEERTKRIDKACQTLAAGKRQP